METEKKFIATGRMWKPMKKELNEDDALKLNSTMLPFN